MLWLQVCMKKGSKPFLSNYRPVSSTCVTCKVTKSIISEIMLWISWEKIYWVSQKKQDTKLLSISSPNIDQFSFLLVLSAKLAMNRPLHIPPHLKCVITLQKSHQLKAQQRQVGRIRECDRQPQIQHSSFNTSYSTVALVLPVSIVVSGVV